MSARSTSSDKSMMSTQQKINTCDLWPGETTIAARVDTSTDAVAGTEQKGPAELFFISKQDLDNAKAAGIISIHADEHGDIHVTTQTRVSAVMLRHGLNIVHRAMLAINDNISTCIDIDANGDCCVTRAIGGENQTQSQPQRSMTSKVRVGVDTLYYTIPMNAQTSAVYGACSRQIAFLDHTRHPCKVMARVYIDNIDRASRVIGVPTALAPNRLRLRLKNMVTDTTRIVVVTLDDTTVKLNESDDEASTCEHRLNHRMRVDLTDTSQPTIMIDERPLHLPKAVIDHRVKAWIERSETTSREVVRVLYVGEDNCSIHLAVGDLVNAQGKCVEEPTLSSRLLVALQTNGEDQQPPPSQGENHGVFDTFLAPDEKSFACIHWSRDTAAGVAYAISKNEAGCEIVNIAAKH